jgi:hypothetical protein
MAHYITQKNQFFTCSPVLIHRHVHSTYLLSHYITHESHLEFLVNSIPQRRLIHYIHFYFTRIHPTLWYFICSPCAQPHACPTQQITFPIGESFGVLLNSLNGGGHLYIPTLSHIGTTYPYYGFSLRFVRWRKYHIATMIHIS